MTSSKERIGIKSKRRQNWFWLENDLVDITTLTIYEKMVYIVLVRLADNVTSTCYPSLEAISKKAGCSTSQVKRVIKTLEEKGLIKKIQRAIENSKEKDTNLYYVFSIEDSQVSPVRTNGKFCENQQVSPVRTNGEFCENQQVSPVRTSKNTNIKNNNIYIDFSYIDEAITHVQIKKDDYQKLIDKFDKNLIENKILQLESYIQNGKGKKYKNHYLVLLNWCRDSNSNNSDKKIVNGINQFDTY